MRQRLAILILLALMLPHAARAYCEGPMSRAEFDRLLKTGATPATIVWPEGVFPLGHPMDLRIAGASEEPVVYRVFASRHGLSDNPIEMPVANVGSDFGAGHTQIRVYLELRGAHRPNFVAPVQFVIIGCEPGALAADAGETLDLPDGLVTFATGERSVSTAAMGAAVAGIALALAVGLAVAAAHTLSRQKEARLGPSDGNRASGVKALFVDFRNRVSLSHFQVFLFFAVVFVAVAYVFGRTRQLSDLSDDVLYLLGISAAGGVAGKIADVSKNRLSWDNWSWLKFDLQAFPDAADSKPSWFQLISTQGEFDIYRFQALCFTLLVAPAFVIMSLYTLGEVNIPPGILAVLGLSQVTYIAGKVAVQPTLSEFDKRVSAFRDRLERRERVTHRQAELFMKEFEAALEVRWNPDHPLSSHPAVEAEAQPARPAPTPPAPPPPVPPETTP